MQALQVMQRTEMKRWGIVAGAALLVVLILLLVVRAWIDPEAQRGRIEAILSASLGRPVHLGHLDLSIFSGDVVATAPSIADDPAFSSQPFLSAKDVRIEVEVVPLVLHHQLHIEGFTIDQPKITLLRSANGTWNYSSLGQQGKRTAPNADTNALIPGLTVGRIDIKDGTLTVGAQPDEGNDRVYEKVNVSARDFAFGTVFPFTVSGKLPGGGTLEMKGTAGPINQRDASLTPVNSQLSLKHADLVAAGFVQPDQGIGGVADLDSRLSSNGQTMQADGTVHVSRLQLAKNGTPSSLPVSVQFSLKQKLQSLSGNLGGAHVRLGRAVFNLAGSYETRGRTTTTHMHVTGQGVPVNELEGFLPSLGVRLPSGSRLEGGTLAVAVEVNGPVENPTISGPVRITNTRLAGFDLGQKLGPMRSLLGNGTGSITTIEALSTDLRYGPDGTRTDNLMAVVSGLGTASGSGFISPGGALDYHLLVKLAGGSVMGAASKTMGVLPGMLGSALGGATGGALGGVMGGVASGAARSGIPVTITGTTSNPIFTADLGRIMAGGVENAVTGGVEKTVTGGVAGGVEKTVTGGVQKGVVGSIQKAFTGESQNPKKKAAPKEDPVSDAIGGFFGRH